jgi:hypothetical protein
MLPDLTSPVSLSERIIEEARGLGFRVWGLRTGIAFVHTISSAGDAAAQIAFSVSPHPQIPSP